MDVGSDVRFSFLAASPIYTKSALADGPQPHVYFVPADACAQAWTRRQ